ncbi:immunoglobulin domain-containing protein [Opitutus terrae]|uniref:Immunoglobulin I-set domain protein n=1 Tax=Opitutus terrae (strain DSM 11246 / JCM 15787 / PB90-1) TaxID=452637 RepID=B2A0C9_OPITP|nr:immunoglobulin domain-containing protein [Opitutus terrae]ACB77883.1 Immunoglobulin I-set domain protein [Opitutus terrae PB90-1]
MNANVFARWLRRLVLLAVAGVTVASAFVLYYDDSDLYLIKWYRTPVVMHVALPTTATLSDGSSLLSSVGVAMQTWNAQLGAVQFSAGAAQTPAYTLGNEINEIAIDKDVDGQAFSSGTLALTMIYSYGNDFAETDIVFNNAYTWDSYRGAVRADRQDIRRVAVHELGHVLGLNHPDQANPRQNVTAIMNSHVSSIEAPQSDDVAGVRTLYGTPGVTPVNDRFGEATVIILTNGQRSMTGSNIGASRESGEPGHAGATGIHSVWWNWTAPSNGTLVADTFGSNFDTVLAVYTGTSVTALTPVAANDDEESPEQNSTPQRKRTSKITTAVTGGTIYRIAVDGWGDNDNSIPDGYTGAITLNLRFSATSETAPVITTQPGSGSIAAGGALSLSVAATSEPAPTYQWQRNGVDVAGGTGATLLLNNVQPADAGLYVAVAKNGTLSTASRAAIVGVTTAAKVIGTGEVVGSDILHSNGNVFDQVLVTGAAEAITADWNLNQITRTSYIDIDGDIVQVEFSGPGTLSLVLDAATAPALAEKYNQPGVLYVTGHAGIVITGATENTNVTVFTVGTGTAVNQALFKTGVSYDGLADIAFIAISSTNGKFGGLRAANTTFFAQRGHTGVYAPGVEFTGPVYVGDVSAYDEAQPVLVLGSASDVRVTGGDMLQANGRPVQVSGIAQLRFTPGSDSHGHTLSAQANRAVYQEGGVDVTARIVVNP